MSIGLLIVIAALALILIRQEKIMADFTALDAKIADLDAKVTAFIASIPPVPPDPQPQIDAAAAAVDAIAAKIPS